MSLKKLIAFALSFTLVIGTLSVGVSARERAPRGEREPRTESRGETRERGERNEVTPAEVSAPPSIAEEAPPVVAEILADPESVTEVDEDVYLEVMNLFVELTDEILDIIYDLIDAFDAIEDEDDEDEWADAFEMLFDSIVELYDAVELMLEIAPEEYEEAHAELLVAVAYIHDAMISLAIAIDALYEGDYDAFEEGIFDFVVEMMVAEALFMSAIGLEYEDEE